MDTRMTMDARKIWECGRELLRETLSKDVFERWISVIHAIGIEDGCLHLGVANDFYSTWLEENYLPLIEKAVRSCSDESLKIRMIVARPASGDRAPPPAPAAVAEAPKAPAKAAPKAHVRETGLNPRYTFESFVVGPSNNFAHAASLAVAQSPARAYNPLFMYGGVGLGKTHLMHAIGNYAGLKPGARIVYMSSEEFTNQYIDALTNHSLVQFRKKYRSVDVLLIDDMQFLGGKERIQEEFFHTFNALFDSHKQIVMTCDRPAGEIPGLEQRLVSRFEWGLVTELEAPDIETRIAILRSKTRDMNLQVPDEVLNFLAKNIRSNVRRLEGALIRAASYASLTNQVMNIESLERLLRDALDQEAQTTLTMEMIQRLVAEYFDIRFSDILSKKRPANIAFPRQVAMFLCRDLTAHSLPSIGEAFGKNHATVLHAVRSIEDRIAKDSTVRQHVTMIKHRLSQRG
ncbi:MAG: chromosomal replication initiator protein DnaA [Kiritimatiellia bacterium]